MTADDGGRRTARRSATTREIVDATWALARERGLSGWALRDVAEAVGMRAPSLYEYFDSKNALYDALFADGYADLLAVVDAMPAGLSPVELLRSAAHVFVDFCADDPARYQLLFLRTIPGFAPSPASYALAGEVVRRLTDVITAAGGTSSAVDMWTAVFTGLASQQIANDPGGDRWKCLVDDAVDMQLAGAHFRSTKTTAGTLS